MYLQKLSKMFEIDDVYTLNTVPILNCEMMTLTFDTIFQFFRSRKPGKNLVYILKFSWKSSKFEDANVKSIW